MHSTISQNPEINQERFVEDSLVYWCRPYYIHRKPARFLKLLYRQKTASLG
jgi:hypothetical protein